MKTTSPNYDPQNKLKLIQKIKLNKYYQGKNWAEINQQMFDRLAPKYDATNLMHCFFLKSYFDLQALKRLPLKNEMKVLDLCTGSGDMALKLKKLYPQIQIVALDYSPEMLKVAKRRAEHHNITGIDWTQGDAMHLPFSDQSFDGVIISFGLRNLSNLVDGLKEMHRVLRPGGFITSIDQGKPHNFFFKLIYRFYFYHIAPLLGKIIFHRGEFNTFRYLPESNDYFPAPEQLVGIFGEIGLKNVRAHSMFCGAINQQIGFKTGASPLG
ncbi:MAG: ubiquinone/menaquinone biosynthesis methyltransferase [Pseudomonadota bacterium]